MFHMLSLRKILSTNLFSPGMECTKKIENNASEHFYSINFYFLVLLTKLYPIAQSCKRPINIYN